VSGSTCISYIHAHSCMWNVRRKSRGKAGKVGETRGVTFACKIGRARMSKVASPFVVAVALGYEVVLFTKRNPLWKTPFPPKKKPPLETHYFLYFRCFLPWCSSCVLRLADLACPFGHFRVHVDKPSDPLYRPPPSFKTRRHCPVLNPLLWVCVCVCDAFVWHSIRKWRFLVNVCQTQRPSPWVWVSVWASARGTERERAKQPANVTPTISALSSLRMLYSYPLSSDASTSMSQQTPSFQQ